MVQESEKQGIVKVTGAGGQGSCFLPGFHTEILGMDCHYPGTKGSHGPLEERLLSFWQAFQGYQIDRVIDYLEIWRIQAVQEGFHLSNGRDGMFSCNGFDTDDGCSGFSSPQEPFKGVTEEVKGFRCVGIRVEGTIGTLVACFRSDNGASKILDKAEVFFEPDKVLVPFVSIGMHRIDVAAENGYGNAPGFKNPAQPAGVSRAQGSCGAARIGECLGEGQLNG